MRKIDIYYNGQYVCSTTQSKTCKEAKERFILNPSYATIDKGLITKTINNIDITGLKTRFSKYNTGGITNEY
jgi:hypothetical protein